MDFFFVEEGGIFYVFFLGLFGVIGFVGFVGVIGVIGFVGFIGVVGVDGDLVYQIVFDNGFFGIEEEWLEFLIGLVGVQGVIGVQGFQFLLGDVGDGFIVVLKLDDLIIINVWMFILYVFSYVIVGFDLIIFGVIGVYMLVVGVVFDGCVMVVESGRLEKVSNLFDLIDLEDVCVNLGFGDVVVLDVGILLGSVVVGDDLWIIGVFLVFGGIIIGNLNVIIYVFGQNFFVVYGFIVWVYDFVLVVNLIEVFNGVFYLVCLNVVVNVLVMKVYWWVGNFGFGLVFGQNLIGLYGLDGIFLVFMNVDLVIFLVGLKIIMIMSQFFVVGFFYWVGLLFNVLVVFMLMCGFGWIGVDVVVNIGFVVLVYWFVWNGLGCMVLLLFFVFVLNIGIDFVGFWVVVGF